LYFDVNTIYEIFMYQRLVLCKLYMELLISKLFCRKGLMDGGEGGREYVKCTAGAPPAVVNKFTSQLSR
jgi:hypothetical protein